MPTTTATTTNLFAAPAEALTVTGEDAGATPHREAPAMPHAASTPGLDRAPMFPLRSARTPDLSTDRRWRLIAAAVLALSAPAMPACAQGAGPVTSADAAMEQHLGKEYKNLGRRIWINPMMPTAIGDAAAIAAPAGQLLQQRLAGYTRSLLDRGGWRNTWASDSHYAAGEPLLAAAVGTGITSAAAPADAPRHVAAR